MFTLTIEMGNAAMEEPEHVAAELRRVANLVDCGNTSGPCVDTNGNTVGSWSLDAD